MLVNNVISSRPHWALPPWQPSGVVLGPLMNSPQALAALSEAVHAAPYKAAPVAPVLYLKPRNTWAQEDTALPAAPDGLVLGASLGLVLGRSVCAAAPEVALDAVAGLVLVLDLHEPHQQFYRPQVRLRARDASLLLGHTLLPLSPALDPHALPLTLQVNGQTRLQASHAPSVRNAAQLLSEVSDFMTLNAGDVLMLGVLDGCPVAHAGDQFELSAPGLGTVRGSLA